MGRDTIHAGDHVLGEDEHRRRIEMRDAMRGERPRVLCDRCRRRIPETKRADAKYCSEHCKRRGRFDTLDEMRKELRRAVRMLKTVGRCACGCALDVRIRPGAVPTRCIRCRKREDMRRLRARRRAERGKEGES